jgi:hypothetical protein
MNEEFDECNQCKNGVIYNNIKLSYPCHNCFDGKKSWLDSIIKPPREKYHRLYLKYFWDNFYILRSAIYSECSKVGCFAKVEIEPSRYDRDLKFVVDKSVAIESATNYILNKDKVRF